MAHEGERYSLYSAVFVTPRGIPVTIWLRAQ